MNAKHLFFAAIALFGFSSCSEMPNDTPTQPNDEPKVFTVSLNMTGEINVSQDILTRFTPDENDLIGIQVSYRPESEYSDKYYAYGLFDNLDNITIDLLENHVYTFEVILINDGKNKIYDDILTIDEVDYVGYGYPFESYISLDDDDDDYWYGGDYQITPITNQFIISEDDYFEALTGGYQLKGTTEVYDCPEDLDVYYGYTENYTPQSDSDVISIFLKRMIYGIKITAGDFLTDGVLTAKIWNRSDGSNYHYVDLTPATKEISIQYAFSDTRVDRVYGSGYSYYDMYTWYMATELDDAYMEIPVGFTWERSNGDVIEWKEDDYVVNRLKQTIINLEYYTDGSVNNNLGITFEDWEISDGMSYTHGEDQEDFEF